MLLATWSHKSIGFVEPLLAVNICGMVLKNTCDLSTASLRGKLKWFAFAQSSRPRLNNVIRCILHRCWRLVHQVLFANDSIENTPEVKPQRLLAPICFAFGPSA